MSKVLRIDLDGKEGWDRCFDDVFSIVKNSGLIVYPTDTSYGLGCNGLDASAVQRIFALKKRLARHPLLLLIPCAEDLPPLVKDIPDRAGRLMKRFWPGPLTLVFKASARIPLPLTGGTGTIGIRVPGRVFTRKMLARVGLPLVGTSANLSGKAGAPDVREIQKDFGDSVDLYVDAGRLEPGKPSTVVDVTGEKPAVIREGKIQEFRFDF